MTKQNNGLTSRIEAGKELILERTFAAPRPLVFDAFTSPDHLRQWWGPRGWAMTHCTLDLRPQGRWHYCIKCMDKAQGEWYGRESWVLAVYETIQAPERLTYTDFFSDPERGINSELPSTHVALTFHELDGGTRVVNHAVYVNEAALKAVLDMGMLNGFSQTWDRLAEHLAKQQ